MSRNHLIISSIFLLLGFGVNAEPSMSNSNWYLGLSASAATISPNNRASSSNYGNWNLKAGYDFSKYMGVEAHLGAGGDAKGIYFFDQGPAAIYSGAFFRGNLPLERVNIYALAGGAYVEDNRDIFGDSYLEPATGIGIELYGNNTTAISFEYMRYGFDDVYETIGVGLVHHLAIPRLR